MVLWRWSRYILSRLIPSYLISWVKVSCKLDEIWRKPLIALLMRTRRLPYMCRSPDSSALNVADVSDPALDILTAPHSDGPWNTKRAIQVRISSLILMNKNTTIDFVRFEIWKQLNWKRQTETKLENLKKMLFSFFSKIDKFTIQIHYCEASTTG